jgi:hypothetical protein
MDPFAGENSSDVRSSASTCAKSGASDTWLWRDGWTQLETPTAPTPRNAPAIAFDSKRQVLVLVGGIDRPGGTQRLDVWELGADGWREVMARR